MLWSRIDDSQEALSRLRWEGPTKDALEEYISCLRAVTGASLVVLFGRARETEWWAGQPLASDETNGTAAQSIRAKLREMIPEWTQSRFTRLGPAQAGRVLAPSEVIETLCILPLRDPSLGPEAALLIGWDGARIPSDEDAVVIRALADQLTWALVAGTLAASQPAGSSTANPGPTSSSTPGGPGSTVSPGGPVAPSPASTARDGLMSFVAHELRTPLTPIMMLLQSVERRAKSGNVDLDALARARRQALRLTRMIGDVVDLSKILDNRLVLDRTSFDLLELVSEVFDTFRSAMPKHRLELFSDVQVQAHVGQAGGPTPTTVLADRTRIERAISNLLEQMERQVPTGGVLSASVSLDPSRTGRAVVIRFSATPTATGSGASTLPTLEPPPPSPTFAQLRGPNLGIFLVTTIANAHGGALAIEPPAGADDGGVQSLALTLPAEATS